MPAVLIGDWSRHQIFTSVIEAGHVHCIERADGGGQFRAAKDLDPAPAAKPMFDGTGPEPVGDKSRLSRRQFEVVDLNSRSPEATFTANGAVTPVGAFGQVQRGDEADRPAVAASPERSLHLAAPRRKLSGDIDAVRMRGPGALNVRLAKTPDTAAKTKLLISLRMIALRLSQLNYCSKDTNQLVY
jgi:hypothetical protein